MTIPPHGSLKMKDGRLFLGRIARGFSLIELLVVVAIIGLLMVGVVPALSGILGGRGVEKSINSVSGVIDLARAEAQARRTRVWVLFQNATNADGNSELRIASFMSLNGLNDMGAANLKPLTKLVKIPGVKNVKYSELPAAVKSVGSSDSVLNNDGSYVSGWIPSGFADVSLAGQSFKDAPYFTFDSDGEILTSSAQDPFGLMFQTQVCLGLASTRGTQVLPSAKDGAIVTAYGGSAKLRISRP